MPLTLASSTPVAAWAPTMSTGAITVANGDILVVKAISEDSIKTLDLPTAPGQTFTIKASDDTASHCTALIATCTVTGSPGTLVVTQTTPYGAGSHMSCVVERWTSAQLAGTPATNATKTVASPNGLSGSVTTVANGSYVTWCAGDWVANTPGTPAYRSSAVQDGLDDQSGGGFYVGYYATQVAASFGAQTFGLTTPVASGTWTYLAIEIENSGAASQHPFQNLSPNPITRTLG